MKNKELIYWADLTGPAVLDEIVRLTIMDTNNNALFNHTFNTRLVDWWCSDLNGISPDDTCILQNRSTQLCNIIIHSCVMKKAIV